jgi:hypothetical protein
MRYKPTSKRVRNFSNFVSGWVLIAMSVALDSDRMKMSDSLLATCSLALIATVGVVLVRLKIEMRPDGIVRVVNPVATWEFHLTQIHEVHGDRLPRLRLVSDELIWLFAAERSLGMQLVRRQVKGFGDLEDASNSDTHVVIERATVRKSYSGDLWYLVPWLLGAALTGVGISFGPV